MIKVIPVSNKRDWQRFYELPLDIYADDKNHCIELIQAVKDDLDVEKNPVFEFCQYKAFIALQNDTCVGRVIAIHNKIFSEKNAEKIVQFAYLESKNEEQIMQALMYAIENFAIEHNAKKIMGDIRFSLNYQAGIQLTGQEHQHTFLMPRQPAYYAELLQKLGYHIEKNLNAYIIDLKEYTIPHEISERAEALREEGFSVRKMKKEDLWPCLLDYNDRWSGNYAHTAFNENELTHLQSNMKLFLDLNFCFVVEKNNHLCGYLFTFPDYNQNLINWKGKLSLIKLIGFIVNFKIRKKIKGLKTAIIGVKTSYNGKQLTAMLNQALLTEALKYKCEYIERSWILEDNIASIKQASRIGGVHYKTYGIFSRKVTQVAAGKVA